MLNTSAEIPDIYETENRIVYGVDHRGFFFHFCQDNILYECRIRAVNETWRVAEAFERLRESRHEEIRIADNPSKVQHVLTLDIVDSAVIAQQIVVIAHSSSHLSLRHDHSAWLVRMSYKKLMEIAIALKHF